METIKFEDLIKDPETIAVVEGLLPEVTVEKNGLMSKNDKFYMPKFSNEEKVHVGKMTSKFSDSNRCDVILGILSSTYKCNFLGADNKQ